MSNAGVMRCMASINEWDECRRYNELMIHVWVSLDEFGE